MGYDISLEVSIEGMEEMLHKLDPSLLLKPLEKFFDKAGRIIKTKAQHRSPIETGRLSGSIFYKVGGGSSKQSVSIEVPGSVASSKGFPYPSALDTGGRYHYRAGPFSGGATQRWWASSLDDAESEVMNYLNDVVGDIQRIWGG